MVGHLDVWKELVWSAFCDDSVSEQWKVLLAQWNQGLGLTRDQAIEFPEEDPEFLWALLEVREIDREMIQSETAWLERRRVQLDSEETYWDLWWVHSKAQA